MIKLSFEKRMTNKESDVPHSPESVRPSWQKQNQRRVRVLRWMYSWATFAYTSTGWLLGERGEPRVNMYNALNNGPTGLLFFVSRRSGERKPLDSDRFPSAGFLRATDCTGCGGSSFAPSERTIISGKTWIFCDKNKCWYMIINAIQAWDKQIFEQLRGKCPPRQ